MAVINLESTSDVLRAAARPTAAFVALFGALFVWETGIGGLFWYGVESWVNAGIVSFFAYAAFILLPVYRVRPPAFWGLVALGAIAGIGSIWFAGVMYLILIINFLDGSLVYHIMGSVLLVPIYTYIPNLILNRRRWAANKRMQPPAFGRG